MSNIRPKIKQYTHKTCPNVEIGKKVRIQNSEWV